MKLLFVLSLFLLLPERRLTGLDDYILYGFFTIDFINKDKEHVRHVIFDGSDNHYNVRGLYPSEESSFGPVMGVNLFAFFRRTDNSITNKAYIMQVDGDGKIWTLTCDNKANQGKETLRMVQEDVPTYAWELETLPSGERRLKDTETGNVLYMHVMKDPNSSGVRPPLFTLGDTTVFNSENCPVENIANISLQKKDLFLRLVGGTIAFVKVQPGEWTLKDFKEANCLGKHSSKKLKDLYPFLSGIKKAIPSSGASDNKRMYYENLESFLEKAHEIVEGYQENEQS